MKIIRIVYDEECGESEAVFDEAGNLIGSWHGNDASWRDEYFNPFMQSLGIKVTRSEDPALIAKLRVAMDYE